MTTRTLAERYSQFPERGDPFFHPFRKGVTAADPDEGVKLLASGTGAARQNRNAMVQCLSVELDPLTHSGN